MNRELDPTSERPIEDLESPFGDRQFLGLWAVGLLSSLVRWVELLAYGVFTYQQSGSAMWVASMMVLRMLPLALFGVGFGAVAARISRRNGLLVTQGAQLGSSLLLLGMSAAGVLEVWHLAVASFVGGAAWAGDMPLRRSLIGELVGPHRMGRAMAFDAIANNGSRLVGPAAGGLLLASGGMTAVFAVASVTYAVVVATVAALRSAPTDHTLDPRRPYKSVGAVLADAFQAARQSPRMIAVLYVTIIFNLFCWPMVSMVPVIAQDQLQLSSRGIGLLASMEGVGAVLGSLMLLMLARRLKQGHVYVGGTILFLGMMPAFALSTLPLLSGAALVLIGAGQASFAVMQATLVFVSSPPERRLEAFGLLTMCIGVAPVGFLLMGWLAERVGASWAVVAIAASGAAIMAVTLRLWRPVLSTGSS
ncbi:MAG: MFS transporter [Pseudomonadota bacterium]